MNLLFQFQPFKFFHTRISMKKFFFCTNLNENQNGLFWISQYRLFSKGLNRNLWWAPVCRAVGWGTRSSFHSLFFVGTLPFATSQRIAFELMSHEQVSFKIFCGMLFTDYLLKTGIY